MEKKEEKREAKTKMKKKWKIKVKRRMEEWREEDEKRKGGERQIFLEKSPCTQKKKVFSEGKNHARTHICIQPHCHTHTHTHTFTHSLTHTVPVSDDQTGTENIDPFARVTATVKFWFTELSLLMVRAFCGETFRDNTLSAVRASATVRGLAGVNEPSDGFENTTETVRLLMLVVWRIAFLVVPLRKYSSRRAEVMEPRRAAVRGAPGGGESKRERREERERKL